MSAPPSSVAARTSAARVRSGARGLSFGLASAARAHPVRRLSRSGGGSWGLRRACRRHRGEGERSTRSRLSSQASDAINIDVKFADGVLTIKGEKQEEKEEKKKDYYLHERHFGSFERSFEVTDGVDADKIEATFKNGVLTVTLPKSPRRRSRRRRSRSRGLGARHRAHVFFGVRQGARVVQTQEVRPNGAPAGRIFPQRFSACCTGAKEHPKPRPPRDG